MIRTQPMEQGVEGAADHPVDALGKHPLKGWYQYVKGQRFLKGFQIQEQFVLDVSSSQSSRPSYPRSSDCDSGH